VRPHTLQPGNFIHNLRSNRSGIVNVVSGRSDEGSRSSQRCVVGGSCRDGGGIDSNGSASLVVRRQQRLVLIPAGRLEVRPSGAFRTDVVERQAPEGRTATQVCVHARMVE
jgi:hypothetical protein